jgi:hypothetical protein
VTPPGEPLLAYLAIAGTRRGRTDATTPKAPASRRSLDIPWHPEGNLSSPNVVNISPRSDDPPPLGARRHTITWCRSLPHSGFGSRSRCDNRGRTPLVYCSLRRPYAPARSQYVEATALPTPIHPVSGKPLSHALRPVEHVNQASRPNAAQPIASAILAPAHPPLIPPDPSVRRVAPAMAVFLRHQVDRPAARAPVRTRSAITNSNTLPA